MIQNVFHSWDYCSGVDGTARKCIVCLLISSKDKQYPYTNFSKDSDNTHKKRQPNYTFNCDRNLTNFLWLDACHRPLNIGNRNYHYRLSQVSKQQTFLQFKFYTRFTRWKNASDFFNIININHDRLKFTIIYIDSNVATSVVMLLIV